MKLSVKVKAGAKKESVERVDQQYKISVKERAVQGKANEAVVKVLSKHFKVPISRIIIKSGKTAKNKIIEID